jgi:CheY-like chemotaxis protein
MAGRAKTVLVVDDDRELLDLIAFVLESEGYAVTTAENGWAGLAAVSRHLPDLVLLDMKMPVLDGWEFARELRHRRNPAVPIVVITAAEDARRRAQEVGAVGWLAKPFDLADLLAVVQENVGAPEEKA